MIKAQIYGTSTIKLIRTIGFVGLLLLLTTNSIAQFSIITGVNNVDIRNDKLLQNQESIFTYHFGVAFRHYSLDSLAKLSVQYELTLNQKGYQQNLDQNYLFKFNYLSAPLLFNYSPTEYFSISAGVEPSVLLFTNIVEGLETYNRFDLGLVFGISALENKWVSVYSRFTYGIVPMLDYVSIDALGNFTGEIHDLKNICFSFGIKVNIFNEKISFNR